ncbi:MAG: thioredoxin-disulfide reductase [Anaerolineaceae bacterium]|nr:thioredoxin-disulfide reductase [Anaerolineaceae bacterium]
MEFNLSGVKKSSTKENEHVKVMVLGSGPAGSAAALYAARAELKPKVLTGMTLGGQAALTHTIENYPGFPDGIGGAELGELFQKQAERFGAEYEFDTATEVDLSTRPLTIRTYGKEFTADTLIITTGANPNHLNVPGEDKYQGKGVSYCGTCDGWFFKDKKIVVVGGGDSALEEGIFLTHFGSSVTIIHRRDEFRAGQILQKRAQNNPKIKFLMDTIVEEIVGEETVQGVRLKNMITGEESVLDTDGVFIFIGHTPNSQLFKGQLNMDDGGYITTDMNLKTNVEGVFVAGEIADPTYRQVITSAGMGAAAAIQATRLLDEMD